MNHEQFHILLTLTVFFCFSIGNSLLIICINNVKVKVLYSREKIRKEKNSRIMKDNNTDRASEGSGSISFVQGTEGMLVSAEVVKDLLAEKKEINKDIN